MDASLQCHTVSVRSFSLLQVLLANESQLLSYIAQKYRAHVKVRMLKVRYHSNVHWVYYHNNAEYSYASYFSEQLESAYRSHKSQYSCNSTDLISFSAMVHITAETHYKINRYEFVSISTSAAEIDFVTEAVGPFPSEAEIQQYEASSPIGCYASCRDFVKIAKKHGLAVGQEQLWGHQNDIQSAIIEMQSVMQKQAMSVSAQPLPAGVSEEGAIKIIRDGNLALAVHRGSVFGTPPDLMMFVQQAQDSYSCIPIPLEMTESEIGSICVRYSLTRESQFLYGKKENITLALSHLTESSAPIPAGTEEAKIQEVIERYSIRREGNLVVGTREGVVAALQELQNAEMSAIYPRFLLAPQVQQVCQKHHVRAENDKIFGTQANVLAALNELNTIVPDGPFHYHRPPQWYLTNTVDLVVVDLPQTDPEYTAVSNMFHMTSGEQITRIRVVQNKRMYTNFAFKHEGYSKVEGRAVEIKRLFHGTRANDPKVIYESDAGLDSRLGGGMWGSGTYYALNSNYSTDYAHPADDGTMEMFLCEVIVGDYVQLPAGHFVKPPQKPNSNSLYHSVKGNTGGSDIWITYEPAMSYPHFIINYY